MANKSFFIFIIHVWLYFFFFPSCWMCGYSPILKHFGSRTLRTSFKRRHCMKLNYYFVFHMHALPYKCHVMCPKFVSRRYPIKCSAQEHTSRLTDNSGVWLRNMFVWKKHLGNKILSDNIWKVEIHENSCWDEMWCEFNTKKKKKKKKKKLWWFLCSMKERSVGKREGMGLTVEGERRYLNGWCITRVTQHQDMAKDTAADITRWWRDLNRCTEKSFVQPLHVFRNNNIFALQ